MANPYSQGKLLLRANYCYKLRVRRLSRCSQMLLLPLGVPPERAPAMLHTEGCVLGGASRLRGYAGWCCRVHVLVHLLRRESSTANPNSGGNL